MKLILCTLSLAEKPFQVTDSLCLDYCLIQCLDAEDGELSFNKFTHEAAMGRFGVIV